MKQLIFPVMACLVVACQSPGDQKNGSTAASEEIPGEITAVHASPAPVIDGQDTDACWQTGTWQLIDKVWIGKLPHATDYMGKFKTAWDSNYLYVLAQIYDDTLIDIHPNGLDKYWDDDCLEIFVDENASGGNHQYNYSAFAYHISLDGRFVDIGPDSLPHYYDDHGLMKMTHNGHVTTWEVALKLFPDTYSDTSTHNVPVKLTAGKVIGFAIAYNDNDKSPERENMMGNVEIEGTDKNRGWIDASVFGKLRME